MTGTPQQIALVGPGRVGQAVGRRLREAGHRIVAVVGRDIQRTEAAANFIGCLDCATTELAAIKSSTIVLLALPDDALAAMAERIVSEALLDQGTVLVHFSGLHGADLLLRKLPKAPLGALSIHPLQSFADPQRGYQALEGVPCAIEGASDLLPLAEQLVRDIGGTPFPLASHHKVLYHAAACITSNYLATLVSTAQTLLSGCGFDADESRRLLGPLFLTTAHNIADIGPQEALTGPISRGDVETVEKHLQALSTQPAFPLQLYRLLGQGTVGLAQSKGTLPKDTGEALAKLLGKGQT